jgi:TRAP-type C4-dicarboxylate transport system permease small subunit
MQFTEPLARLPDFFSWRSVYLLWRKSLLVNWAQSSPRGTSSRVFASFLGLAYSFRSGSHIRVTLFIQRLNNTGSRVMLILALAVATAISGLLAYHTIVMVVQNASRGEVTSGLISVPLWLPQIGMAIGVTLFCVAIVEDLVNAILNRPAIFNQNELARTQLDAGKDGLADP